MTGHLPAVRAADAATGVQVAAPAAAPGALPHGAELPYLVGAYAVSVVVLIGLWLAARRALIRAGEARRGKAETDHDG
ncbi:MAG: hypothetical protein KatS3mg119_0143 [Rhodothalassiaceae bacterium]|nr:MAG: hypothetical protein KatS3mg119_0143 [Rhodothalassiaceae bacterium]